MSHDHESTISLKQLKTADFKKGRAHSDLLLYHTTISYCSVAEVAVQPTVRTETGEII